MYNSNNIYDQAMASDPRWDGHIINFPDGRVLTLGGILGEGQYGVVREGVISGGVGIVAIKMQRLHSYTRSRHISPDTFRTKTRRAMQREYVVLETMEQQRENLPGCATVQQYYGSFHVGARFFFVLRAYQTSFRAALSDFTCDTERINGYIEDICCGMQLLHQCGFVHNDIKLDNIMIDTENDCAVVIDFGLTVPIKVAARSITFSGTPLYASPEKKKRRPYGISSDVYSLGILIFEAFSSIRLGRTHHHFGEIVDVKARIMLKDTLCPVLDEHLLDTEIRRLIERCCSEAPEKRPSTSDVCILLADAEFMCF